MDMQQAIVILCVVAAACYFARRMYRAVKKGTCACCDGGGGNSGCGCRQPMRATRLTPPAKDAAPRILEKTLAVQGMKCAACAERTQQALIGIGGVEEAKADPRKGIVTVALSRDIPDSSLEQAVGAAGYVFQGVTAVRATK